jgi:tRNA pseudouridine55 synthase
MADSMSRVNEASDGPASEPTSERSHRKPHRPSSTASGLLLVDKPQGWTSHDAVARTRRLAGTRKVGHAGTLDPLATGLLILGINSSTRLLTYIVGLDKEYLATIRLGASTSTDDSEGEELVRASVVAVAAITPEAVAAGIAAQSGDIAQQPSAVSAIKVDGKRAYARVRAGEEVDLPARPVTVSAFELLSTTATDGFLDLTVRVECSSGTYIRALARDLGAALGVGGHLTSLRRTRIGPFLIGAAQPLAELDVASALIGPTDAATRILGRLDLTEQQAIDLGHGKRIQIDPARQADGPVAAVAPDGRLVGLVEYRGDHAKALVNFPPDETAPRTAATPEVAPPVEAVPPVEDAAPGAGATS